MNVLSASRKLFTPVSKFQRLQGRGTTSAKPPEVVASVGRRYGRQQIQRLLPGHLPSTSIARNERAVPLFQAHQTMSYPHFQPRLAEAPGSQIAHLCLPRRFIPSNEHDKRFLIFYLAKLNTNPTCILYLVPPRCQHSPIPVAFGTTPPAIRYPHASEPHVEALHAWLCGDTSSAWTWSSGASKVPAMGEDSFSTAHHIATYELPNMAQNGNLCQMGKIRTFETARCLELWLIRAGLVPRKERSRSSSSWNQKFGFKWCQEMWCFWEPFSTRYPPCQNQAQQGLLSLLRFESGSSSIGSLQDTQMPGVLLWLNIPFKVSSQMFRPKLFLAIFEKKQNKMGPLDGHQTIEHAMALYCIVLCSVLIYIYILYRYILL